MTGAIMTLLLNYVNKGNKSSAILPIRSYKK